MKVYRRDVNLVATAYLVAENEEQAEELFRKLETSCFDDVRGLVDGRKFSAMKEEGEDIGMGFGTISPAVTFKGGFDDEKVEEVE